MEFAGRGRIPRGRSRFGQSSDLVRGIIGLDASGWARPMLSARFFMRSTLKRYTILTRFQPLCSILPDPMGLDHRCSLSTANVQKRGLPPFQWNEALAKTGSVRWANVVASHQPMKWGGILSHNKIGNRPLFLISCLSARTACEYQSV